MCLFKSDKFKCGCQLYYEGGLEPCDDYRETGKGLDVLATVLIPRTDEHNNIAESIDGLRYQTMPHDTNKLFRWHSCPNQTYAPVESKNLCPWHDEGTKNKWLERAEKSEKRQRGKVGGRHEREEPREMKQGLEKEHGCVVQ